MEEPKIDDLELLERSCSTFVLRYLYVHPGANKSTVMSAEGRNLSTKNRRIGELLVYRLINAEEGNGREMNLYLTEDGRKVAECLNTIDEILKKQRIGINDDETAYISPDADEIMRSVKTSSKT